MNRKSHQDMIPRQTSFLLAAMGLMPALLNAQPLVDIQLHRADDGALQVLLMPTHDFDGLLSSLVLTLTWDSTRLADEPILSQTPDQLLALPLEPSGPMISAGPKKYRKYAGISLTPLLETSVRMQSGKSLCIARVHAVEADAVLIADDPWLRERRHNGAFYLSLNGLDKTGQVIPVAPATASIEGHDLVVAPNPYGGGPLSYTLNATEGGMAQVLLQDAQGRTVTQWPIMLVAGMNTGVLSPPLLAAGSYTIRIQLTGKVTTVPLVAVDR